jgi:hypothetical protein
LVIEPAHEKAPPKRSSHVIYASIRCGSRGEENAGGTLRDLMSIARPPARGSAAAADDAKPQLKGIGAGAGSRGGDYSFHKSDRADGPGEHARHCVRSLECWLDRFVDKFCGRPTARWRLGRALRGPTAARIGRRPAIIWASHADPADAGLRGPALFPAGVTATKCTALYALGTPWV